MDDVREFVGLWGLLVFRDEHRASAARTAEAFGLTTRTVNRAWRRHPSKGRFDYAEAARRDSLSTDPPPENVEAIHGMWRRAAR